MLSNLIKFQKNILREEISNKFFNLFFIFGTCLSSTSSTNSNHNMVPRGAFIVFEGCDRSGKTTQCKKLVEYLNEKNISAKFMNFPDRTTSTGHIINDYLQKKIELTDQAAHLLFSANRWERQPILIELINQGTTVICDRYSFSGIAFSSAKKSLNMSWCYEPEKGLPKPDAVLLFKLSEEAMKERKGFGDERYEQTEFQKIVAENFEKLKDESWIEVNAAKDIEHVGSVVKDIALDIIKKSQFSPLQKL